MKIITLLVILVTLQYATNISCFLYYHNKLISKHISKIELSLNINTNSFNDNINSSYKSLYILPNSPVSLKSVINFLQRWAYEQSSTGSAITLQKEKDSILFNFNLIKDTYLEIRAIDKNHNNEIHIQSKLNIPVLTNYSEIQQQQILSLIKLASDNLLDSITNEIGSLIMEIPTKTQQPSNQIVNDKEDEVIIIDEEDLDMEYFQTNAKELSSVIPDQTYINSIWKQNDINNNTNTIRNEDNNMNSISTRYNSMTNVDATTTTISPSNQQDLDLININVDEEVVENNDRIIYSWRNIDSVSATSNILIALQTWAAKFTRKGVGIEMISIADGIQIDLAISDLIYINFIVMKQSNSMVQVILDIVDIKNNKLLNNNEELRNVLNNTEIYDMIVKVTANLSKNLKNYLQDIYIATSQLESSHSTTIESNLSSITNKIASPPLVIDIPRDDVIYAIPEAMNAINQANTLLNSNINPSPSLQQLEDPTTSVAIPPPKDFQVEGIINNKNENHNNNMKDTTDNQQYLNPKTSTSKSSSSTMPKRKSFKDPTTLRNAQDIGLNLEKFEGLGMEESAMEELNNMLKNSRQEGFISFIQNYDTNNNNINNNNTNMIMNDKNIQDNNSNNNLSELFEKGKEFSTLTLQNIMSRPPISRTMSETTEDLLQPTTQLPIYLKDNALAKGEGGIDIFQSPSELYNSISSTTSSTSGSDYTVGTTSASSVYIQEIIQKQSQTPPEEETYDLDKQRLDMLLVELNRTSIEFHDNIIDAYRDLLLSDNFLYILRDANKTVFDWNTRQFFKKLTEKSIYLTAELGALVKSESVRHLQTIQDICEIASELQHDEVKFLERMYYIKPRFDTAFLAYLNYAIQEESIKLKQTLGITDVNMHASDWLQILQIIKQGTIAEFESRYNQLLEPLLLVIRFQDPILRENIFQRFINITPVMELPFMKALALNMISNIIIRSNIDVENVINPFNNKPYSSADNTKNYDETLIKSMKDLKALVDKYLTDEIIQNKINEFEVEVNKQGKSIVIRNRNPVIQAEIETLQDLNNKNINNILNSSNNNDVEYIKLLDNL